ncbi:uncharacterized protein LOC106080964 [Stomoxys calcitrans]|uniref:Cuticle protein n=1 Tax=Stomoxys calcitrans TaxID=35570 RepID=A0A1I8Q1Q9_STOCA|nr:uncharacterized protein LOC106080964 [Stomoxys calcitrans]
MKFLVIFALALAVCHSAPIDDEAAVKAKRGLHFGVGYHAPIISHSYVAPAVVHHAPLISHAPIIAHAPIVAHAPLLTSHHILPSYHSYHHFK